MENINLVSPKKVYKNEYFNYIQEHLDLNITMPSYYALTDIDFNNMIEQFDNDKRGKNLKNGYVPSTTYWLITTNQLIGTLNIRHKLNEHLSNIGGHIGYRIRPSKMNKGYGTAMLKLGLDKCKKLNLNKVLITCLETNIASAKVIIKNGGIYHSNSIDQGLIFQKYWIKIK